MMTTEHRHGATDQSSGLRTLARLATETGSAGLAAEADTLADRVSEGRFYVVCVGQFKRGKSTLLNALVGSSVLPMGVIPVTSVVTVIRHGERLSARVRFAAGDWKDCQPSELSAYVSEEGNPGNEKGVVAAEVFVPSPLLESGMCLVDTPGLGSISLANTLATQAFVPHIDAAVVVLGADPPISGEELALVEELVKSVHDLVFVLNKADRQSDVERREAIAFTGRVLKERLRTSPIPILEVSAAERLVGGGASRDWERLVTTLESLARMSSSDLVRAAEARGVAYIAEQLLAELDEQQAALTRPIEESQARLDRLQRAVNDAQSLLQDLGHRLAAVEERLYRAFSEARDRFFHAALSEAERELIVAIRAEAVVGPVLRQRAIDLAAAVIRRRLDQWRSEQEPQAEALYRDAVHRFVELANVCREALVAVPGLERLPPLHIEGLTQKSSFYYTEMLNIAPASPVTHLLDRLFGPLRRGEIERGTVRYLTRLLEVNSARIKNDFHERVVESRRLLEREIRDRLRHLSSTAERALDVAREAQMAGSAAVNQRLEGIRLLRSKIESVRAQQPSP